MTKKQQRNYTSVQQLVHLAVKRRIAELPAQLRDSAREDVWHSLCRLTAETKPDLRWGWIASILSELRLRDDRGLRAAKALLRY